MNDTFELVIVILVFGQINKGYLTKTTKATLVKAFNTCEGFQSARMARTSWNEPVAWNKISVIALTKIYL